MNPILNNVEFSLILLEAFKWALITGAGLYAIFAFVVLRQIAIMKKTLITELSPEFSTLGYVHMAFAIGMLILFLVWL